MPRNMASDTIDFKSYLQLAIDFFSAPEILPRIEKVGRKACGITFPLPELIIGGGAVPFFIPRLNKGSKYDIIKATITARDLLGMNNIARGLTFLKNIDKTGTVLNIAGSVINDIIFSLNETYENAAREGVDSGLPNDHCYGAKALFGLYKRLGKQLDMNLGIDIRCSVFFAYHESLTINNFVPNNFIMDMPYGESEKAIDFFEQEIWKFIEFQEKVTGKKFDMNKFYNVLVDSNKVKRLMKEIYLDIAPKDIIPCSPATFSELQSLLVYSNIDFNSGLKRYAKNLEALVQEMHDRVDQASKRFDATGYPIMIYTPMFGGFEPEIATFADEMKARVYYPDWLIYGVYEEVKTSGNLIRNYARALLNFQRGIGLSNKQMSNNILNVAKKMNASGIIFCEVFGCRSMCTAHRLLRDISRRDEDLNVPINVITFENIGNSIEAVKTRVNAFIEMIRE
ncbi:MAG: 2-hydroxyacyl-CoA dehydratase family protein [Promethearchaeota archaeon]